MPFGLLKNKAQGAQPREVGKQSVSVRMLGGLGDVSCGQQCVSVRYGSAEQMGCFLEGEWPLD